MWIHNLAIALNETEISNEWIKKISNKGQLMLNQQRRKTVLSFSRDKNKQIRCLCLTNSFTDKEI